MALWLILALLAAAAIYAVSLYNGLVGRRNQVRNGWSQIDVQLKRRHDLIPNLVNAVKGYLSHERSAIDAVVQARERAISAGSDVAARASSENQLTGALRSLFAVAEAYPELKASQNMLALQEELGSTENKVAFARQHYSDAVQRYNTALESFPGNLLAARFGFAPATPFGLEIEAERAVPEVRF